MEAVWSDRRDDPLAPRVDPLTTVRALGVGLSFAFASLTIAFAVAIGISVIV